MKIRFDGMKTEGYPAPFRRTIFDHESVCCGTVITVPYIAIVSIKRAASTDAALLAYYWEFLTVMNNASTRRVVSGFRKE